MVLKSYIAIFNSIKYKTMPILEEPKPNNLASQLQCTTTFELLCTVAQCKKKKNLFMGSH